MSFDDHFTQGRSVVFETVTCDCDAWNMHTGTATANCKRRDAAAANICPTLFLRTMSVRTMALRAIVRSADTVVHDLAKGAAPRRMRGSAQTGTDPCLSTS